MSKHVRVFIGIIALTIISGGAWFLMRSNSDSNLIEKEISIKQAEPLKTQSEIHEDFAGFLFEYPGELKVQEIEMDDDSIYSSLEVVSAEGSKVTLRVADTKLKNLEDWQASFEEKNVVISIKDAFFSDIGAKTVVFGAPKEIKTIAVEEGVIYELTGPADGGYFEKVHDEILNSFEFKAEVFEEVTDEPTGPGLEGEEEDKEIILIEEIVE